MPTETVTKNEPVASGRRTRLTADGSELRALALKQIERMRTLKLRAAAYLLGMLVLTPVWIAVEYVSTDGWPQRLSDNGKPGDWNPWIIWVALAWGFYVAVTVLAIYFRRPTSEAEIECKIERLRSRD